MGSLAVCGLYLEQISLGRAIDEQQRALVEAQQFASMAPTYENSWKQLATRVYQMSRDDKAFLDVLQRNQIAVQSNPAPSAGDSISPSAPPDSNSKPPTGR